jgi:hypothetical protein
MFMPSVKPESWLKVTARGLYCEPGDFYVDPHRPVGRLVTCIRAAAEIHNKNVIAIY